MKANQTFREALVDAAGPENIGLSRAGSGGSIIARMDTRTILIALAACGAVSACASTPKSLKAELTVEDQLRRVEELGRDLHQYDLLSARATDVLFEKVGPAPDERVRGYVAVVSKRRVDFVAGAGENVVRFYSVDLSGEKPTVTTFNGEKLPEPEASMFRAIGTAAQKFEPKCDAAHNTAVLPDPDGSGWLVYFLVGTQQEQAVPVAGHVRIAVSQDGRTIKEVTPLSRSCLVLQRPPGGQEAALYVSHLVSPLPVETHVFVNLLYGVQLFVATEGSTWSVEDGKIRRVEAQ